MKAKRLQTSFALVALALSVSGGCTQKMGETGHLRPLEGAPANARVSGVLPEGTVAQNGAGFDEDAPPAVTKALLETGRVQYNAYCLPCHGPSGNGDGMIVQRGFLAPPSYHIDRLRAAPDQHLYDVITNGYGAMYSYADRVSPRDRWAITAYIRALQLSQNAKARELPPRVQEQLRKATTR
jgi:mono/diheme cytochrome c family protein